MKDLALVHTANPPIVLNPNGRVAGLITVDHAGLSVPDALGDLGLAPAWRDTHYFSDLGVAALARAIAARLDVTVILCDVSRLVIDVNRWIQDPNAYPTDLEGTPVPANITLDDPARHAREEAVFWPYHEQVGAAWAQKCATHPRPFFFALHSCTRVFQGVTRPWDAGTIWNDDQSLSAHMLDCLGRYGDLTLGDNQPYTGRNGVFTVDRHTYGSGLPACGFEVTNDGLTTPDDIDRWADRLVSALSTPIGESL